MMEIQLLVMVVVQIVRKNVATMHNALVILPVSQVYVNPVVIIVNVMLEMPV